MLNTSDTKNNYQNNNCQNNTFNLRIDLCRVRLTSFADKAAPVQMPRSQVS